MAGGHDNMGSCIKELLVRKVENHWSKTTCLLYPSSKPVSHWLLLKQLCRSTASCPIQPMELFPLVLPPLCSEPSSIHAGKCHRSNQAAQTHSKGHHFFLPHSADPGRREGRMAVGGLEQAVFKQEREHHVGSCFWGLASPLCSLPVLGLRPIPKFLP